jgi:hypothetical protein
MYKKPGYLYIFSLSCLFFQFSCTLRPFPSYEVQAKTA